MAGIEECLRQGADVIVNTDADNQYKRGRYSETGRPDCSLPGGNGGR